MRTRSLTTFLAATTFALGAAACADEPSAPDDPDVVADALEQEHGGLDMEDEAPMFGAEADLAAAEVEPTTIYTDALDADADVVAMRELPNAVRGRVVLAWGQLPPDVEPEAYAREWTGRLSLDRGAMVVRRTIGFEDATDRVLPRTDRLAVDFESITRPFADGLVLEIIDPDPTNAEPLTLRYERAAGGEVSLDLVSLLDGPETLVVDSEGNRMVALALRDGDACDHGFVRGRWRALRDEVGGMLGEVVDADGAVIGHIRGIWGERRDGEQVFFGKYINVAGEFRGIFGGHYEDGQLVGRWLTRAGEHGRLDGRYEAASPDRPLAGHFGMRWAETSCAGDLPDEGLSP